MCSNCDYGSVRSASSNGIDRYENTVSLSLRPSMALLFIFVFNTLLVHCESSLRLLDVNDVQGLPTWRADVDEAQRHTCKARSNDGVTEY
jgi:hypothetical protein